MARWTSMTMKEFRTAFREGERKGRVSWFDFLFRVASMGPFILALEVTRHALHHELDRHLAVQYLGSMATFLLFFAFVMTFALRRPELRPVDTFLWAITACMSAGTVLILCLPRIN